MAREAAYCCAIGARCFRCSLLSFRKSALGECQPTGRALRREARPADVAVGKTMMNMVSTTWRRGSSRRCRASDRRFNDNMMLIMLEELSSTRTRAGGDWAVDGGPGAAPPPGPPRGWGGWGGLAPRAIASTAFHVMRPPRVTSHCHGRWGEGGAGRGVRVPRATLSIARCVPPARDHMEQPSSSPGALCPCGETGGTVPGGVRFACRCQLTSCVRQSDCMACSGGTGADGGTGTGPSSLAAPHTDRLTTYAAPVGPGAGLRDAPTAALRS